ncbi:hypothetical protein MIMGU_mgv1a021424mg [Erythranthe guttata]|uniref:Dynamin N-terminal domain-containing protein n=1 Tax=Erythranthe guttata TaxID=4155 RepID=A0A022Q8D3_ERYGU|nr:hypothetical protein MIMGU_mgv1a021424mg [Erythranthe guttata]
MLYETICYKKSGLLRMVVRGHGAGKSAVLNSLIGHPVLPTGVGGATRAPTYVDLIWSRLLDMETIVTHNTESESEESCPWFLQESIRTNWREHGQKIFKFSTSTAPPLKLADMPGVDNLNLDRSLKEYAEPSNAILLVVIPADQALNVLSAQAIQIAKKLDAEGARTVGVITNIDRAKSVPNVLIAVKCLLLNNGPASISNIPWVAMVECVTLHGHDKSLETKIAWENEYNSLKRILEGVPESKLGRFALVETLAQKIRQRMEFRLRNLSTGVAVFVLGGGICWYMGYESVVSTRFLLTGLVGYGLSFLKEVHSTGMMAKDLSKLKSTFWNKKKNQ